MKKAKIGILTYWGVPNYGAWVQAYALNRKVNEVVKDKYSVKHINYLNQSHFDVYYKKDKKLLNSFNYSWNIIDSTEKLKERQLEETFFDKIITGSDAIWEFSVPEMGNDRHLIGNNLKTNSLISYAASSGVTTSEDIKENWVKKGLEEYDYISVRDFNTQKFVNDIIDERPEIVLDPALIWDFKSDKNVKLPVYDNYIAVYGSQWDDEFIYNAQRFAKENNLKLISIGFINNWCDVSIKMNELRTLEWLGFIKNADYVFTSTFHGFMCSIAFEKQLKFNRVSYVKNRSETLLKELNGGFDVYLSDKIDFKKAFLNDICYDEINKNLDKMRKKSVEFLKGALEIGSSEA